MSDQETTDYLDYLQGLPRAQPGPQVWEGIERRVTGGAKIRYLSTTDWRRIAAAAILLIGFNTAAIWSQEQGSDTALSMVDETSLLPDYQLYE